jgi:Protein of unknown function (DUF1592)/Protein of unknown function (DUF1588)/Protein of unknown function (DUF1595)/Protein of unknown function (DUF1585)
MSTHCTIIGSRIWAAAWTVVFVSACTGVISEPGGDWQPPTGSGAATSGGSGVGSSGGVGTGGTGTGTGGSGPFACQVNTVDPGPSTMQLLTVEQYLNTMHDLVGANPQVDTLFAGAISPKTFGLVQGNVAQVDLETYGKAAETVATGLTGDATKLNGLAPCAATADKRTCARTFLSSFASRAYRAPLTDGADIERHLALYDVGASTSYAHGIEMLLRGVLQAPRFLYRAEPGTSEQVGPNAVKLSGHEVATRLSYTLWNTMPDAKLTALAADGTLGTKEAVAAQLTWMLADPRGAKSVRRFVEGWLALSDVDTIVKDGQAFPDWSGSSLRTALKGQAQTFFDYVLASQSGSLSSLLTSTTVFVNQAVSGYYGVTGGAAFQPIERADGTVSGMLTLPALLSMLAKPLESSPIYRGKFVREQLLCQELPAPPPNVPNPPDTMPGVSTREKFKEHETNPACAGCHTLMDPLGLGFENFDAVGRYRTIDNGQPVDASGEAFSTADMDGKFVGVVELGKKLAASAEVEECVARQWFRFFLSRFEQDVDGCSMKNLVDQFRASGKSLNSLPVAVVQTDAFLYRRPID